MHELYIKPNEQFFLKFLSILELDLRKGVEPLLCRQDYIYILTILGDYCRGREGLRNLIWSKIMFPCPTNNTNRNFNYEPVTVLGFIGLITFSS